MEQINIWSQTLLTFMTTFWAKLANFLPNLFGAVIILVIGYFVAKAICFLLNKGLAKAGFNTLSDKVGIKAMLGRANVSITASDIVAKLGFWLIMLTFLVTATETLGLPRVSETLDEFVLYLPKVIAAILILIVGLFVAHIMRDLVRGSAEGIGVDYAKPLGTAVYGVLFVVVISLAVNQLEINTKLLDNIISILLAAIGVAVALSLGLGTRDLAASILAGVYARDIYPAGSKIELEGVKGTLQCVGTIKTIIESEKGNIISVSNRLLIDSKVVHTPYK